MADDFIQAYVGREVEVLFEDRKIHPEEDGLHDEFGPYAVHVYEGHTTNYIKVKATSEKDLTNVICKTKITKAEKEELFGTAEA